MERPTFYIHGRHFAADDPGLQPALAQIYETAERPRCLCRPGGVEMYVAKCGHYVIKRMPESGNQHHPACPSFEPDWGQSGLGNLLGDAIVEHAPDAVEVRVDFPLERRAGRSIPVGECETPGDIQTARRRLSLRALLHFLWDRACFNRWYPAMAGKRSWGVIRKFLLEAAQDIHTKGVRLADRLYVPEPFSEARRQEIAERRRAQLAWLHLAETEGRYRMVLVIGEFKAVESSSVGYKVWLKHLPDCPLLIDSKGWERLQRVFAPLFEAREADTGAQLRLVMCAIVYAKRERTYQIDAATCMLVTDNWIPIEGVHESDLIRHLTEQGRRFLKPLAFDARSPAAFPNALLLDVGDQPVPLHVVSPFLPVKEHAAKQKAIDGKCAWIWHTDQPMPALPPTALT